MLNSQDYFSFGFLNISILQKRRNSKIKKAPDLNETKLSVRQEFEVEVESPPNPDQIFITTNPDRDDLRLGQGILTTILPKMTCLILK